MRRIQPENPRAWDLFAGGGSIPLELRIRLVSQLRTTTIQSHISFASPTVNIPRSSGYPERERSLVTTSGNSAETEIAVPNVLIHDVSKWGASHFRGYAEANWLSVSGRERRTSNLDLSVGAHGTLFQSQLSRGDPSATKSAVAHGHAKDRLESQC